MLEVSVSRAIAADAERVAALMFDANKDAYWVGGIRHSEILTQGSLAVGSKVRHDGGFLWKKFSWVTEIVALEPGRTMAMKFLSGPFKGGVTYSVAADGPGCTASIEITGKASFAAPFMALMMRRSLRADLGRLQKLAVNK